MTLSSRIDRIR